jgi:hypothetical protein
LIFRWFAQDIANYIRNNCPIQSEEVIVCPAVFALAMILITLTLRVFIVICFWRCARNAGSNASRYSTYIVSIVFLIIGILLAGYRSITVVYNQIELAPVKAQYQDTFSRVDWFYDSKYYDACYINGATNTMIV